MIPSDAEARIRSLERRAIGLYRLMAETDDRLGLVDQDVMMSRARVGAGGECTGQVLIHVRKSNGDPVVGFVTVTQGGRTITSGVTTGLGERPFTLPGGTYSFAVAATGYATRTFGLLVPCDRTTEYTVILSAAPAPVTCAACSRSDMPTALNLTDSIVGAVPLSYVSGTLWRGCVLVSKSDLASNPLAFNCGANASGTAPVGYQFDCSTNRLSVFVIACSDIVGGAGVRLVAGKTCADMVYSGSIFYNPPDATAPFTNPATYLQLGGTCSPLNLSATYKTGAVAGSGSHFFAASALWGDSTVVNFTLTE